MIALDSRKLWLVTMTTAGHEANLRAMIEPVVEFFHGVVATFHYPADIGAAYLESVKGEGRIVYANWCQRHGYSMTHALWQGPMQEGDRFIYLDSTERISPAFCQGRLPGLLSLMDEADVAMVANYGKGLLFRYNEQLEFRGSPHWFATNLDGRAINVELDKTTEFWNVRNEQRASDEWVSHYLRYMLEYPAGSNHALLGLDTYGDPNALFPPREARRLEFRKLVRRRGYPVTVDGFKAMLSNPAELDTEMKGFLNGDKVWSDAYWGLVVGDTSKLVHSHKPTDALPIL